ncbi:MAG: ParA family protein [Candidatus Hydrogenedentes bacterium]|nr:ParA family protein [Candidatus Hydrogenedentota bacterium]
MGRVIAVANQKGGVGKTTTAVNLAACLAAAERRVLLVDLDPQGNATQGLGIDKNDLERHLYHLLVDGVPPQELARSTDVRGLSILPANRDMVGAEVELVEAEGREYRLRRGLETIRNSYDYIIIDCPPSLGLLTLNGLVAADGVLVPLQCEYYALVGLSELLQTIILVRDNLNPHLRVHGVLLTMYQHTNLSKQVVDDVRNHLGEKVFETIIPRNVTLSEAPSFGKPVIYYDLRSSGAQAYLSMAREVIARG